MLIIGLIGMPGAGKGECAKIGSELGYPIVSMGDLVREHVRGIGLKMTDDNVGGTANAERQRFGYDIWAKRTVDTINEKYPAIVGTIIIDGIRGDAEVAVFRAAFGDDFRTVYVNMPEEMRFRLLKNRKRSDAPLTWEDFKARDDRESKWGILRAIEGADYIIMNNGTLDDLKDNFSELLKLVTGIE